METKRTYKSHRTRQDLPNHFICLLDTTDSAVEATIAMDLPHGAAFIALMPDELRAFAADLIAAADHCDGNAERMMYAKKSAAA